MTPVSSTPEPIVPLAPRVSTWADGFGVWHARVPRDCVGPLLAARRAIRDELMARENNVPRWAFIDLVRVPELDGPDRDGDPSVVYREGNPPQ